MGSLVELARIAKNDAYIVDGYSQPRKRISGSNAAMGAGAGIAGYGGIVANRGRKLETRSYARASDARNKARAAAGNYKIGSKRYKTALLAEANAKAAERAAVSSPAQGKYLRRFGGKIALTGAGVAATGAGIKGLNNGA